MTYQLTIKQKPTYLHAIVTGENNMENIARYLEEVTQICEEANCTLVLIEERMEGPRLKTLDIFQLAAEGSRHAFGKYRAIAYVDIYAEGDLMQFAETVAVNRAVPVKLFSTVAEAENWLLTED